MPAIIDVHKSVVRFLASPEKTSLIRRAWNEVWPSIKAGVRAALPTAVAALIGLGIAKVKQTTARIEAETKKTPPTLAAPKRRSRGSRRQRRR